MTFSFKPCNGSTLPLIAASVRILVVSWNDAALSQESLSKAAFVIPRIKGAATAGLKLFSIALAFSASNS